MKTFASLLCMMVIPFLGIAQDPAMNQDFRNIEPNPINKLQHRLDSVMVMACPAFESNGLQRWEKYNYYYDFVGQHNTTLFSKWNADSEAWEKNSKTEFFLNPNGSIAKSIFYIWDPVSAEWHDALKKEFTYDINQNLLSETEYAGGNPIVPWMPHYKAEYTWNQDNKILSTVMSNYYVDEASWNFEYRTDYIYHANGHLLSQTESVWKKNLASWVFTYRHEYSYGENWKLVVKTELSWNQDISLWENRYKTVYAYNFLEKPETITRFWWYAESSQWRWTYKDEYVYDFMGNMTRKTGSSWDHFVSSWYADSKNEYEYNLAVTTDELVNPQDIGQFGYSSRNMLTKICHFRNIGGTWTSDYQYAYYYNTFDVSGIEESGMTSIRVFPNPASNMLTFSWDDGSHGRFVEVYDLGGKLVLKQSIYHNVNIDISSLPEGGYLYKLYDRKLFPLSGKFTVVR